MVREAHAVVIQAAMEIRTETVLTGMVAMEMVLVMAASAVSVALAVLEALDLLVRKRSLICRLHETL